MKKDIDMKAIRLFVMTVILGISITTGYSQKHHGRFDAKGRTEDRINKMDEVVKFTGDQKTQVQTLFNDMAKMKKDAFCANEMGSDGMKKAMKKIKEEKEARLKKILSKDQMNLWKAHIKEHKPEKNGKGKHDGKDKPKTMDDRINGKLDKMNEVVKFTGSQKEDLKKLFADLAKRGKEAVCNNEPGSDTFKAEMKKINEDRKEGMKKILTEDQVKLWKDHKKSKHDHHKKEDKSDDKKGSDRLDKEK